MTADPDLTTLTRALTRALTRITTDGPTLIRRAAISSDVDGYSTTASGAPPSSATTPPDEPPTIDYSDPTGRAIVIRSHHRLADPIDAYARRFLRRLEEAERAMHHALLELDMATPRGALDIDTDEGWCVSCARDGGYREPAAPGRYAKHCRFCGEFSAANGFDPPLEIVRAKHEGRRITTTLVTLAMANQRKHQVRRAS